MNTLTIRLVVILALTSWLQAARAEESQPLSFGPFELLPSGKSMVAVGGGEFNAFLQQDLVEGDASAELNLEYRWGKKIAYIGFTVGGLVNSDGGSFVYLGNYAEIKYKRFIATPVLSLGAYQQGAGPDLGGTFQFRSSLTLDYVIEEGSRIGVRVAHISNAGIHDENPGLNEFLVMYTFSF